MGLLIPVPAHPPDHHGRQQQSIDVFLLSQRSTWRGRTVQGLVGQGRAEHAPPRRPPSLRFCVLPVQLAHTFSPEMAKVPFFGADFDANTDSLCTLAYGILNMVCACSTCPCSFNTCPCSFNHASSTPHPRLIHTSPNPHPHPTQASSTPHPSLIHTPPTPHPHLTQPASTPHHLTYAYLSKERFFSMQIPLMLNCMVLVQATRLLQSETPGSKATLESFPLQFGAGNQPHA